MNANADRPMADIRAEIPAARTPRSARALRRRVRLRLSVAAAALLIGSSSAASSAPSSPAAIGIHCAEGCDAVLQRHQQQGCVDSRAGRLRTGRPGGARLVQTIFDSGHGALVASRGEAADPRGSRADQCHSLAPLLPDDRVATGHSCSSDQGQLV